MADPILVAIAAAVAGKSAGSLYDLVKRKLGKGKAADTLAAAEGAAPESEEVNALHAELEAAETADPTFSAALRKLWLDQSVEQVADRGGVANQISGNVREKVVQARDIGKITF